MEDGSTYTLKHSKIKTEVERCYATKTRKRGGYSEKENKTGEHGQWKLDSSTPNREEMAQEELCSDLHAEYNHSYYITS